VADSLTRTHLIDRVSAENDRGPRERSITPPPMTPEQATVKSLGDRVIACERALDVYVKQHSALEARVQMLETVLTNYMYAQSWAGRRARLLAWMKGVFRA
jgi:hypothetical protein